MSADRVLIVEQNSTGHRLFYARLLAEAASERGAQVCLLLHRDGDPTAEGVHLSSLPAAVEVLREPLLSLDQISALSVRQRTTRTVVPDGDRFALALARRRTWNGSGAVSVLIMRENAQPRGNSGLDRTITRVKSILRTLAFRRVDRMRGVDLRVLKAAGWSGQSLFRPAVDPVHVDLENGAVDQFRRSHALAPDRYWFAILGAVSGRKNLDLVLEALARLGVPWGLLVAGTIDEDVPRHVHERLRLLADAGKAVVIDRLLSDAELDAAVGAADCIVLAHSNEGPSGLLGKAAAVGTRVVAAGATSLRQDLQGLPGVGEWAELTVPALAERLGRATSLPAPAPVLRTGSTDFTDALL